jgi:cell division protein FtsB
MMVFPLIIIIGGLFLVSNDMGFVRWYQLHNERNLVQMEINRLIKEEVELTGELDRLTNDKKYIKKIAQEKFHMVKPGEKIFRVIDRRNIK